MELDLSNKTVLIVGGASNVPSVLPPADFTIAASSGVEHAPNADVLMSIDGVPTPHGSGAMKSAFAAFQGLFLVGVPSDAPKAIEVYIPYESHNGVHFRNNGIAAIRLALNAGAAKVLLCGFDPVGYDAFNADFGYTGLTANVFDSLLLEYPGRISFYVPPEPVPVPPQKKK